MLAATIVPDRHESGTMVSERYRCNAGLWLPDQGSNLGPAD
jgi:hypothetical protein